MSFQRTLLFTFAMSAAAFGCHKDRSGTPESSNSVVEGTTPDTTANVNTAPAPAADTVTPSTTDTTVPSNTDTTATTGTAKRANRTTGTAAVTTGTTTTTTTTDTTVNTATGTGTTGAAATTGTTTPNAQPTTAPTPAPTGKDQQMQPDDRKTLRQGTGWYRSDRNDQPKGSTGQ